MASDRPTPATDEDRRAHRDEHARERRDEPHGAHMLRDGSPAASRDRRLGPDRLRITAIVDGAGKECDRRGGVDGARRPVRRTRHARLGRPRRGLARAGHGGRPDPRDPPADRRGRPGRQPAGEDRDHRRRRPHRPVPPDLRRRGRRLGAGHRPGAGLPAHRARRLVGAVAPRRTCARGSSRSSSTAPTTCCGRWPTTSSTAISRSPTSSATPSTTSRTRSSARPRRRRSSSSSSSSGSSSSSVARSARSARCSTS